MQDETTNTLALVAGRGVAIVLRGVTFILIARNLGPDNYGVFASTAAVLAIVYPIFCCGTPHLLVQRYTEGYGFLHGRRSFRIVSTISPFVAVAVIGLSFFWLPTFSLEYVLFVFFMFLSEVYLYFIQDLCFAMFQATDQIYISVPYRVGTTAARLFGVLILHWSGHFTLLTLALIQLIAAGVGSLLFFSGTRKHIRHQREPRIREMPELSTDARLGFQFAVGLLAANMTRDVDKTMLPRLASLNATGLYSSGFRLIEMTFMPVLAYFNVIFPRYFVAGKVGKKTLWLVVSRAYRWALGYSVLASSTLFLVAPFAPLILGDGYSETTKVIRWLAPIIVIRSLQYPLADALTGFRRQAVRSKIQLSVLVLNVLLNFVLIPIYGWAGAAIATLVSETTLLISIGITLFQIKEESADNGD